jgi:hypothetical protein
MQHAVLQLGYFRACIKWQIAYPARAQTWDVYRSLKIIQTPTATSIMIERDRWVLPGQSHEVIGARRFPRAVSLACQPRTFSIGRL